MKPMAAAGLRNDAPGDGDEPACVACNDEPARLARNDKTVRLGRKDMIVGGDDGQHSEKLGSRRGSSPTASKRRIPLWQGFAISFLLHAGLALPFFVSLNWSSAKHEQTLVMEFEGEISNLQTQAKTVTAEDPSPTPPPPVKAEEPEKKVVPKQPLAPRKPPPKPKPPTIDATEQAKPEVSAPVPAPAPASADVPHPAANEQDVQRTIAHRMSQNELEQAYARAVSLKLGSKLDCSDFSGKLGVSAVVKVEFRIGESGYIRSDTLRVVKSSGFPEMDQLGLATVRAAAPFELPPRELSFVLDLKCLTR